MNGGEDAVVGAVPALADPLVLTPGIVLALYQTSFTWGSGSSSESRGGTRGGPRVAASADPSADASADAAAPGVPLDGGGGGRVRDGSSGRASRGDGAGKGSVGTGGAAGRSFVLHDVSMAVGQGEFVCVIGRVGAGKTTLLLSILGETHKLKGSIALRGSIAYVVAWAGPV